MSAITAAIHTVWNIAYPKSMIAAGQPQKPQGQMNGSINQFHQVVYDQWEAKKRSSGSGLLKYGIMLLLGSAVGASIVLYFVMI